MKKVQKKSCSQIIGRLSITNYLKNGSLIGFANYLLINRFIPSVNITCKVHYGMMSTYSIVLGVKFISNDNKYILTKVSSDIPC